MVVQMERCDIRRGLLSVVHLELFLFKNCRDLCLLPKLNKLVCFSMVYKKIVLVQNKSIL
jgi:hypothetical protein